MGVVRAGRMQQSRSKLIEIPGGSHLLERPQGPPNCHARHRGLVRFWLQDYVNPNPDKQEQNTRWEMLRTFESNEDQRSCTSEPGTAPFVLQGRKRVCPFASANRRNFLATLPLLRTRSLTRKCDIASD